MAIVSVLPRVRTVVLCDEVLPNPIEEGVFTLEGVHQRLLARSFPWQASLSVFLLLSSPRTGDYSGKILVVNQRTEKVVRLARFRASFDEDNQLLPLYVEVSACVFPEAGWYNFEVCFSAREEGEGLKGEHPFTVLAEKE
jgi:hypothetical protein